MSAEEIKTAENDIKHLKGQLTSTLYPSVLKVSEAANAIEATTNKTAEPLLDPDKNPFVRGAATGGGGGGGGCVIL